MEGVHGTSYQCDLFPLGPRGYSHECDGAPDAVFPCYPFPYMFGAVSVFQKGFYVPNVSCLVGGRAAQRLFECATITILTLVLGSVVGSVCREARKR